MPDSVIFEPQLVNWVLVTSANVPGLAVQSGVVEAAGAQPTSVIQVADVAVVDFPGLQVSYVGVGPQRYHCTVAEKGVTGASDRLSRVTAVFFRQIIPLQPPIAIGCNFVRAAVVADRPAGRHLLGLLSPEVLRASKVAGRPLTGAGVKLFYDFDHWRVTVTLEPDAGNPTRLTASANFHWEEPKIGDADEWLRSTLGQAEAFREAFERILDVLLEDRARVTR